MCIYLSVCVVVFFSHIFNIRIRELIIPWRCQLISEIGTTWGADWGRRRRREECGGVCQSKDSVKLRVVYRMGWGGVSVVRWLGDWVVTAIVGYAIK